MMRLLLVETSSFIQVLYGRLFHERGQTTANSAFRAEVEYTESQNYHTLQTGTRADRGNSVITSR